MDFNWMKMKFIKNALFRKNRTNEQKIYYNRMSILELNEDCQLEIIKYIIADCEMRDKSRGNKMKYYADLVNFALSHENFEIILKRYYQDLYKSLEFAFAANRRKLEIDFSELETTHAGKGGDVVWRVFANGIEVNKVVRKVVLIYDPESFQPNFLDHFDLIKRALEHKESINYVTIRLNGYSLEDLNNFGHITHLDLDVRMSAKALVEVCKSNPHLKKLAFRSTEILGRLSDIAPHCRNLTDLLFAPKPDIDGVEYAPLAELPNLRKMILYRAFENGSQLTIFDSITKWKRPGLQPLKITFNECLPHLSSVNIARANSFLELNLRNDDEAGIHLIASYDFWDISRDNSPLENSLATIPLIAAELVIDYKQLTLYECPKSDTDINGFYSILKLFNIKSLKLWAEEEEISKLIALIISVKSLDLKSINIHNTEIDQSVTSELVKIKSITSLDCNFSDWESVELLSALTNLETVNVIVFEEFEMTSSKALCSLINTCSASGRIRCFGWCIEFEKIESIIGQSKRTTALKIFRNKGAILHIEALSYRDLITIEELDVSHHHGENIKDILKIAEVQPIKKLRYAVYVYDDFEHLSDLAELEDLTIRKYVNVSLKKLLYQYATQESSSLQCLEIDANKLSSDELHLVSKIRSLKKLQLCVFEPVNCQSLMELANSNIEELILSTSYSLLNLFSAFAAKSTSRLQHLKIEGEKYLKLRELKVLFKIKTLKSLQCRCLNNDVSFLRNFKHLVELDIKLLKESNLEGLRSLGELEQLESLTLRLNKYSLLNHYDFLADIQNLKELNLLVGTDYVDVEVDVDVNVDVNVNLTNLYQAIVRKNVKLTHLTTPIGCVEELNEITKIKTLRKLQLFVRSIGTKLTCLGELSELVSLQIIVPPFSYYSDSGDDNGIDLFYLMDCVIPILRCCRNLDRLLINSMDYLRDIYTHLKSIRHPTLHGPLTVILTEVQDDDVFFKEYNIPDNLMVQFENVYMKVYSPRFSLD